MQRAEGETNINHFNMLGVEKTSETSTQAARSHNTHSLTERCRNRSRSSSSSHHQTYHHHLSATCRQLHKTTDGCEVHQQGSRQVFSVHIHKCDTPSDPARRQMSLLSNCHPLMMSAGEWDDFLVQIVSMWFLRPWCGSDDRDGLVVGVLGRVILAKRRAEWSHIAWWGFLSLGCGVTIKSVLTGCVL